MKTETVAHTSKCELILALDLDEKSEALALLDRLENALDWVKVGLQMFTRWGPDLLDEVASRGYRVFLDLKLHDIPNTVAGSIKSLIHRPVQMLTLHASGGPEMISAARAARVDSGGNVKLVAVTILTSMDETILARIGMNGPMEDRVGSLGEMAVGAGADGLVCSPHELDALRKRLGTLPLLVTPGIRPAESDPGDQKRIMTPAMAASAGTNFIVVGRPILKADNPHAATVQITEELNEVSSSHG